MVALNFDATSEPPSNITVTFGRSRSEIKWTDRRTMSFANFAKLLSSAAVGPKDGACFTPAVFSGQLRRLDQATQIDVVVLDADSGNTLQEIQSAIEAKGWRAIIHSTYSHLTEQTPIGANAYDKWAADQHGPTVERYLAEKKGYLPRVVKDAQIMEEIHDGQTRSYLVKHQPCPKFRVVLPLQDPWIAAEFENQTIANATWKERIGALAHAITLHHDQSCVDTSRLFYLPRRREGQEFLTLVIEGEDCPLWTLPEATSSAQEDQPLFKPRSISNDHKIFRATDGQWIDLTTWAARYANRFEISTAIKARAPHLIGTRRTGVKMHIECPNATSHVTGELDRTGTFVVNASQNEQAGLPSCSGFIVHCMHAGCAGLNRLDHVNKLLCDGALKISDLTDSEFLVPEFPLVDPTTLLNGKQPQNSGNIPPQLYAELPGVLRLMHDYINATSPKPQPALNLGASLAFMAAAIGQRVQLQYWETRPNIYVLGVAHSGAGKERALSACKQMARSAGLSAELIGIEEVASDSGIVTAVMQNPRQMILLDEVSFLIGSTNNRHAGVHIVNVTSTLLKLYSSSHTVFKGKAYADAEKVKTVDQPCVSLYGCSTPSGLFSALSAKDIKSGLLSRTVLFDAGDYDPKGRPPTQTPVPQAITDWLLAWNKISPIQNAVAMHGGTVVIEPRVTMMTAEAQTIADQFADEMDAIKLKARESDTDALYVRANENALKFALIRACAVLPEKSDTGSPSIDLSALRVDAETMRWAVDLSRATVTAMERAAKEDITDGVFEMNRKSLRDFIRKQGARGATLRDIARGPGRRLTEREADELYKSLTTAGEMAWVEFPNPPGRSGRKRCAFVHCNFVNKNKDEPDDD